METLTFNHEYHQCLTYKITCGLKPDTVVYNFEQCLEIIRNIHDMTRGLKQIVYLVGWQYDGHDSKYPAFFEVNERLARPGETGIESMLWVIEEAKQYNAVVSTHINLCDAYETSPLWDEYVTDDLIVRDADGSFQKGGIWDGEQSYRVSKTREWAVGKTQERIRCLLELLPIAEAGTVHIDAFFPKPSPFHGVTMEDEVRTIQDIFRHWHSLGVDVTGELFIHDYAGFLPLAWNFNGDESTRLKYPASILCGGGPGWNARHCKDAEQVAWVGVFTAPEAGCLYDVAWGHSGVGHAELGRLNDRFAGVVFVNTLVWLMMNSRSIVRHVHTRESYEVHFSDGLESIVRTADGRHTVTDNGRLIVDGGDVFVPAIWRENECFAYSSEGGARSWEIPAAWNGCASVRLTTTYPSSSDEFQVVPVSGGRIDISLQPGQAVAVEPVY